MNKKETIEIDGWIVDIRCPKNADQAYKNELARELIEMKISVELEDLENYE
jgi:hypothetical protein